MPGDIADFAAALGSFADSAEWQARLAQGALEARDSLRIERMVEQFDAAVCTTIARRRDVRSLDPMPAE